MRLIEKDGEFTQNIALVTYDETYIISGVAFVQNVRIINILSKRFFSIICIQVGKRWKADDSYSESVLAVIIHLCSR